MENKNKKRTYTTPAMRRRRALIKWSLILIGLASLTYYTWQAGCWTYRWLFVWEFASADTSPTTHQTVDQSALSALNGTPMEASKPFILKASKYYGLPVSLYLGIANAESSFKHFTNYNPWGIKPNNKLKAYQNWEQSVNGFSQLLKYYYWNEGLQSAAELELKYVGYPDSTWIANVQAFHDIK